VLNADRKVIIVTRKTRLDELVARFNTVSQAKFYVEHLGADFGEIEREAQQYQNALRTVEGAVRALARVQLIERAFLPNFLFGPTDVVIAVGQDGVVANTMKYLNGQALLGVNPDPQRYDGVLLPFVSKDIAKVLADVLAERRPARSVTMAQVSLLDGQRLYAVNDLFIGPKSHTSARYEVAVHGEREVQSSSGIIVSTGLGSTAWYRSVVTGACAVADSLGAAPAACAFEPLPWDAPHLKFAVREPFPSKTTHARLVYGTLDAAESLTIRSLMPEHGVIFSDGIENDFLAFNSGTLATVTIADRTGHLIH
jgi:NAD kinase